VIPTVIYIETLLSASLSNVFQNISIDSYNWPFAKRCLLDYFYSL